MQLSQGAVFTLTGCSKLAICKLQKLYDLQWGDVTHGRIWHDVTRCHKWHDVTWCHTLHMSCDLTRCNLIWRDVTHNMMWRDVTNGMMWHDVTYHTSWRELTRCTVIWYDLMSHIWCDMMPHMASCEVKSMSHLIYKSITQYHILLQPRLCRVNRQLRTEYNWPTQWLYCGI